MRKPLARLAYALFLVGAGIYAAIELRAHWREIAATAAGLSPDWPLVAASCVCVLVAYALLVQTWRTLLGAWGSHLPYLDAARIWSVSNLGRYLPGAGWQVSAMAAMARREQVPAAAAGGAAVVSALVTLSSGSAVTAVAGASLLDLSTAARWVIYAACAALLLAAPLITAAGRLAARVLGRPLNIPTLTHRMVAEATLLSGVAWCCYGLGFAWLARALVPGVPRNFGVYAGTFTGAYLFGFINFWTPAGFGAREGALTGALRQAGFAAGPVAILVLAQRLWLTALEISSAAAFLAVDALVRRSERLERGG